MPWAQVVYKRYASLYFVMGIDVADNELITLEVIHHYVEVLDRYFGNVCELDLIFNFHKARRDSPATAYRIHRNHAASWTGSVWKGASNKTPKTLHNTEGLYEHRAHPHDQRVLQERCRLQIGSKALCTQGLVTMAL